MITNSTNLPLGYSSIAPGHVVSVVTCLEMTKKPNISDLSLPEGTKLELLQQPDLEAYRSLFRKIGSDWLWYSRLIMHDDELNLILTNTDSKIFVVRQKGADIGLLELDFSQRGACELVFLGIDATLTGQGLGGILMNKAVQLAWSQPIERLWLHTCTFDHPSALKFYLRNGFKPYAYKVEVQADPRLTGHLPMDAAPHVPIIELLK